MSPVKSGSDAAKRFRYRANYPRARSGIWQGKVCARMRGITGVPRIPAVFRRIGAVDAVRVTGGPGRATRDRCGVGHTLFRRPADFCFQVSSRGLRRNLVEVEPVWLPNARGWIGQEADTGLVPRSRSSDRSATSSVRLLTKKRSPIRFAEHLRAVEQVVRGQLGVICERGGSQRRAIVLAPNDSRSSVPRSSSPTWVKREPIYWYVPVTYPSIPASHPIDTSLPGQAETSARSPVARPAMMNVRATLARSRDSDSLSARISPRCTMPLRRSKRPFNLPVAVVWRHWKYQRHRPRDGVECSAGRRHVK